MKGAGSGRGDGEERDLKSGVVGRGEGSFSPEVAKVPENTGF